MMTNDTELDGEAKMFITDQNQESHGVTSAVPPVLFFTEDRRFHRVSQTFLFHFK